MAKDTSQHDQLIRFLLPQAHTRGAIIRGTHIVREAARVHGLSGAISEVFGQTLLASVLLLSINKGGVRQVLQLDAISDPLQSPLTRMLAETGYGDVRGYLSWREDGISMHNNSGNKLSDWMGSPVRLSTVRDLGVGQPYVSTIENDSDFLADHLVHYLHQSVQTRADIIISGDLAIMIEAMPGSEEERWFDAIRAMASIPEEALATDTPETILSGHFAKLGCQIVSSDSYAYRCRCSQEKMEQALAAIPENELAELMDEHGKIRISCQYCDQFYELFPSL